MFKRFSKFILVILFCFIGCAGRQPKPVLIIQTGDENKSCQEIDVELKEIREEIWERHPKIKENEDYNLGVGLVGSLFPPFIPFALFSDYKKADLVELNALQRRHNHLVEVERKNGCGFEHSLMPVQEVKTLLPKTN